MKLIEAVNKVLEEKPKTRDNAYLWLYIVEVLKKMGFKIFIEFDGRMPSPESIIKERRSILNKPDPKTGKPKFHADFAPEEGVTYEQPNKK